VTHLLKLCPTFDHKPSHSHLLGNSLFGVSLFSRDFFSVIGVGAKVLYICTDNKDEERFKSICDFFVYTGLQYEGGFGSRFVFGSLDPWC